MALRDELVRRISRKLQEVAALEQQQSALAQQIGIAKAYAQAMEEALRMAERDAVAPITTGKSLRRGSGPGKAQKALRQAGQPLHITRLLVEMGLPVNRKTRSTLSSALATYARKGEVFTRTAPNTFGLIEFGPVPDAAASLDTEGEPESEGPNIRLAR